MHTLLSPVLPRLPGNPSLVLRQYPHIFSHLSESNRRFSLRFVKTSHFLSLKMSTVGKVCHYVVILLFPTKLSDDYMQGGCCLGVWPASVDRGHRGLTTTSPRGTRQDLLHWRLSHGYLSPSTTLRDLLRLDRCLRCVYSLW